MIKRNLVIILVFIGVLNTIQAQNNSSTKLLTIGDEAPGIDVLKWLKGNPVQGFEKGSVYVVEFWATWCGPCIMAMPHLSELARQYRDQATFIGVSVWEGNRGAAVDPAKIQSFVDNKGKDMDYTVAMDDPTKNTTAENWLRASGQGGIPATFVIDRQGKIAWIGHPSNLDTVLSQIVHTPERFDLEQTKLAHDIATKRQAIQLAGKSVLGAVMGKNYGTAWQQARKLMNDMPGFETENYGIIVQTYLKYNADSARAYVEQKSKDAEFLKAIEKDKEFDVASEALQNSFAKMIAQQSGLEISLYYDAVNKLNQAVKKNPNGLFWGAIAEGYMNLNEPGKAVAAQQKAIKETKLSMKPANSSKKEDMLAALYERTLANMHKKLANFKEMEKKKAKLK